MGKEFVELFEKWAETYDNSVTGHDLEYKDVFLHYEQLLQEVADRSFGHVLEFGPGTGNLTAKLLKNGLQVTAAEPSSSMREIAINKLGDQADIIDGDFFNYPLHRPIDTIVSTYAFHHLTDEEKAAAIANYGNILAIGGKIVFADTMYESVEAHKKAITDALEKGFQNLAEDLQREYYTTIPFLRGIMEQNGFEVKFERWNEFVWIMEGVKK
ncbi:methyltransferase domain-containing protein [Bacillus sp. FJAT-29790]|uniref:class I SAM-dependent methyltransferase n=1 Tax=Bacillus sp. FJAT-29790 TaxID=1895002 RepID=UPI001C24C929|nr:class I SAM-dependent methyltransferase [Bacillus sp. FJAT-29790]MBU8879481.1 methyltransferase domain-containing protein [Bacillus sp. FJAT-29790]